jgi:hypothetical protein
MPEERNAWHRAEANADRLLSFGPSQTDRLACAWKVGINNPMRFRLAERGALQISFDGIQPQTCPD